MRATEILRQEHENILRMLRVAGRAADRLRGGQELPSRQDLEDLVEFVRGYADGTHHAKEEKCLFPWMARHGFSQGHGPLHCMNAEHETGRALTREIAAGIGRLPASAPELAGALGRYVQLLADHIQKENCILFVMADQLGDGDPELLPAYQQAVPGAGSTEARFLGILARLEKSLGAPAAAAQKVG